MNECVPITNDMIEEMSQQYTPLLLGRACFILRGYYNCKDVAEEIVQETWVRVLRTGCLEPGSNVRGWLYTITSNLARDRRRSDRLRKAAAEQVSLDLINDDTELPYGSAVLRTPRESEPEARLIDKELPARVFARFTPRELEVARRLLAEQGPRQICAEMPMHRNTFYKAVRPSMRRKVDAALAVEIA